MSKRRLNQYIPTIKKQVIIGQTIASESSSFKIQRSVIGRMPLLETDKLEGINQSINNEVQVPASRHINETDKEKNPSSSMMRTKYQAKQIFKRR